MTTQTKTTWRKVKLGEVLSVSGGGTPSTHNSEYWNGDIPWLTPAEVSGFSGRFFEKTKRNISKKGLQHSSAKLMPPGSLLLTSRATIGDVVINKVPMATNQGFINIEHSKEIDQIFLFYWLRRNRDYFNQIAVGSTFPELIKSVFKEIEIELPDFTDQKRIADILSAFDDKIELNNKISRTLEQMAQVIFKEWFVNFKFPGHEKVKIVDSELGKIPEGWGVKKIDDVAKIKKGLSYSSEEIRENNGGIPMINLANFVKGGGFKIEGTKFFSGKYKVSNLVKSGDIIIALTDLTSNREVIGHPAKVPEIKGWDKILISLDVCSLETADNLKTFFYYLMLRRSFSHLMASSASGTNVSHLSQSNIKDYLFVFPPDEVLNSFYNLVKPISDRINRLSSENQKLAALRDLLLPKLMSGEINVAS